MSDDLVARLRALGGWPSFDDPDQVLAYVVAADEAGTEAADCIEELEAEREDLVSKYVAQDVLAVVERERDAALADVAKLREALAPLMSWPGGIPKRWVADDEVSPIEAEALMTVRALLHPEDGER